MVYIYKIYKFFPFVNLSVFCRYINLCFVSNFSKNLILIYTVLSIVDCIYYLNRVTYKTLFINTYTCTWTHVTSLTSSYIVLLLSPLKTHPSPRIENPSVYEGTHGLLSTLENVPVMWILNGFLIFSNA